MKEVDLDLGFVMFWGWEVRVFVDFFYWWVNLLRIRRVIGVF